MFPVRRQVANTLVLNRRGHVASLFAVIHRIVVNRKLPEISGPCLNSAFYLKRALCVVYEALFRPNDRLNEPPMKVAVKCLKGSFDQYIDRDVRDFLQECAIMVDFCHANVMPLLGVNLHDNDGNIDPKLILPFCANGNVHTFVSSAENVTSKKRFKLHFCATKTFYERSKLLCPFRSCPCRKSLTFLLQIANGMKYLSTDLRTAKMVHRDLRGSQHSVRKLDENMSIVISDFGLSRAVQQLQGETYVVKRNRSTPWQWAAPEVLESCQFSTKSDVWSFGVVVWEMLEKGSVPYGEIHDEDQALAFLRSGGRLRWPTCCPANLHDVLLHCWNYCPANRPSFAELYVMISEIIRALNAPAVV
ncbi:putative Tyrosine-protein kinase transforming protein RYK [Hypsibius exemplaris]|uniref:Tyrosine-protein kinase transforming protein RYK n=1 Tax=Hypsibius exemplaris TaxID=2072580 RepID=A0A9X6NHZ2_HYPEX|nr:putative Tyrosine-protein kinase transforming protein RYK [Hypsibius exemplaris]